MNMQCLHATAAACQPQLPALPAQAGPLRMTVAQQQAHPSCSRAPAHPAPSARWSRTGAGPPPPPSPPAARPPGPQTRPPRPAPPPCSAAGQQLEAQHAALLCSDPPSHPSTSANAQALFPLPRLPLSPAGGAGVQGQRDHKGGGVRGVVAEGGGRCGEAAQHQVRVHRAAKRGAALREGRGAGGRGRRARQLRRHPRARYGAQRAAARLGGGPAALLPHSAPTCVVQCVKQNSGDTRTPTPGGPAGRQQSLGTRCGRRQAQCRAGPAWLPPTRPAWHDARSSNSAPQWQQQQQRRRRRRAPRSKAPRSMPQYCSTLCVAHALPSGRRHTSPSVTFQLPPPPLARPPPPLARPPPPRARPWPPPWPLLLAPPCWAGLPPLPGGLATSPSISACMSNSRRMWASAVVDEGRCERQEGARDRQ